MAVNVFASIALLWALMDFQLFMITFTIIVLTFLTFVRFKQF